MACADKYPAGRYYHSEQIDFVASEKGNTLELDFLKPALDIMKDRGTVRSLDFRLHFSDFDVATPGAAREELLARMLARLVMKTKGTTRVDVTGASLRVADYIEFSNFQMSRNFEQGEQQSVVAWLHIPVEPCNADTPQDYRWVLEDLVEGGECQLDFSSATIGPEAGNQLIIQAARVQLWVEVIDEGRSKIAKTHTVLRDFPITKANEVFNLSGGQYQNPRVRWACQYLGEVGESKLLSADQLWASQAISSRSLDLTSVNDDVLKMQYRKRIHPRRTAPGLAADEHDPVERGSAIVLYPPSCAQPQSEMPPMGALDWETDDTFATGTFVATNKPKMIVFYTVDRPEKCEPEGPRNVKLGNGLEKPVESFPAGSDLPKKLPTVPA